MRKWLISFVVMGVLIISLLKINYLYTEEKDSNACDMRRTKSLQYCETCDKCLTGYICWSCKKKAFREKKNDTEGKPDYLFYEEEVTFGKCPVCKGKLKPTVLVDKRGKCIVCGEKVKKMNICVKIVYACPKHPEKELFKPGRCSEKVTNEKGKSKKCSQKRVIKYISQAKVSLTYTCSKCGYSTPTAPGADAKCPGCGTIGTLVGKFTCEKSGEFPHINVKEWEKSQKDQ